MGYDDALANEGLVELSLPTRAYSTWTDRLIHSDPVQFTRGLQLSEQLFQPLQFPVKFEPDAPFSKNLINISLSTGMDMYGRFGLTGLASQACAVGYMKENQFREAIAFNLEKTDREMAEYLEEGGYFLSIARGELARQSSLLHNSLVERMIETHRSGKTLDRAAYQEVEEHLEASAKATELSGDPDLTRSLQVLRFWVVHHLRPEGWEKTLDELIAQTRTEFEKPHNILPLVHALFVEGMGRQQQGRREEAVEALNRCLALFEKVLIRHGPEAARKHSGWLRELYENLAEMQISLGRGEDAASTMDRLNQLSTITTFELRDLNPRSASSKEMVERASTLQAEVQVLETQTRHTEESAQVLAQTRSEFYTALRRLQSEEPAYARLSVRPDNFSKVQKKLPKGLLVVQVFPAEETTYLFLATKDQLKIVSVKASRENLDKGVMSFLRQVRRSGGKAMIATLWKVPDQPTRVLMRELYTQLKAGTSRAVALQEAQLKLLRDPETSNPYNWAPFILIGDYR